jgi:hypothetical protein
MRKSVIYILMATVLGLLITLVPLLAIGAESEHNGVLSSMRVGESMEMLEGRSYNMNIASSWSGELGFLAITFVVALVIYLLLRRKVQPDTRVRPIHYPF